jgi:hypothetical protein
MSVSETIRHVSRNPKLYIDIWFFENKINSISLVSKILKFNIDYLALKKNRRT